MGIVLSFVKNLIPSYAFILHPSGEAPPPLSSYVVMERLYFAGPFASNALVYSLPLKKIPLSPDPSNACINMLFLTLTFPCTSNTVPLDVLGSLAIPSSGIWLLEVGFSLIVGVAVPGV